MKSEIRLSQCMIVKNEEKNIRRALSWGKDIVYEQIVVDTGSTDRTVEIAEEMGAKVYHFVWKDDFSAAKNYAIEQASGEWIAFLDADEYYSKEHAVKLMEIISNVTGKLEKKGIPGVIRSSWLQLNNEGKVFSTSVQDRVFMNNPYLRYRNRIHENLKYKDSGEFILIDASNTLSIYHTGYSSASYQETGKIDRNIHLLQKEVEMDPHNLNAWSYLGDSLLGAGRTEEAEKAYKTALYSELQGDVLFTSRRNVAFANLTKIIIYKNQCKIEEREKQIQDLYNRFLSFQALYPDMEYLMGVWMLMQNREEEACHWLEEALVKLEVYKGTESLIFSSRLNETYRNLVRLYGKSQNLPQVVRYCCLALRMDRYQADIAGRLLTLLYAEDMIAVFGILQKIYDFSSMKDRLFVMRSAKATHFDSLYEHIFGLFNEAEKEWFVKQPEESKGEQENLPELVCKEITIHNENDRQFLRLMEETGRKSESELLAELKDRLDELKKHQQQNYTTFVDYFHKFTFWGKLQPEKSCYEVLENRVHVLKEHREDFLWLYGKLEDNRSKKTLFAILDNWLNLHFSLLGRVKDNDVSYFDTDLIPGGEEEVFVDMGAFTGDTVHDFITTYGRRYKRIYCYEITSDAVKELNRAAANYGNVIVRQKAVSSSAGTLYLAANEEISANQLTNAGTVPVEAVTIDEDIEEKVTFIKMDIEGSEQAALLGCKRHIREEHPKLAICTYHGYEDIWKIPRLIAEIDPSYRFYMRHYGGNLIPTEFVLYAL